MLTCVSHLLQVDCDGLTTLHTVTTEHVPAIINPGGENIGNLAEVWTILLDTRLPCPALPCPALPCPALPHIA